MGKIAAVFAAVSAIAPAISAVSSIGSIFGGGKSSPSITLPPPPPAPEAPKVVEDAQPEAASGTGSLDIEAARVRALKRRKESRGKGGLLARKGDEAATTSPTLLGN
jgi:hypothetical protein